jgi:RimJ/RimL family protein N-acetyltransferase
MSRRVESLSGERLYLRPLEVTDLELCQVWINDPEIRPYLSRAFPADRAGQRAWIEKQDRGDIRSGLALAIVLREGNRHIGNMGLHRINWIHRSAETGTLIGERDCWSQGYGSEAKLLLVEYAFNTLGLNRLSSRVLATNPRSLACQLKCGYVEEGRIRQAMFKDGQWVDEILLGLLAEEWRTARNK